MNISIHALLAESDHPFEMSSSGKEYFYPRSPCGERQDINSGSYHIKRFLSTLSLRRATLRQILRCRRPLYFYPRSPCGERPSLKSAQALLAQISIHALLAESDQNFRRIWQNDTNFYPRSPCGERQHENAGGMYRYEFLSTLSLRRATVEKVPADVFYAAFLSTLSLRRATNCSRNGFAIL